MKHKEVNKMNKMTSLVCGLLTVGAVVSARAATSTVTGDITQSTDYTINVDSGDTVTYSGNITLTGTAKLIKDGLGKVILSGNNTLPSGIIITKGTVQADSAGALGDGPITIKQAKTYQGKLFYNAEGATFNNPTITISETVTSTDSYAPIQVMKKVTIAANIEAKKGAYFGNDSSDHKADVVFDGTVSVGTSNAFYLKPYGSLTFNKTVTCGTMTTSRQASQTGTIVLNGTANSIKAIETYYAGVTAGSENAFGGASILNKYVKNGSTYNVFELGGYNQTITYFSTAADTATPTSGQCFKSIAPATLTLKGGATGATAASTFQIGANVALLCDFTNTDFTQRITGRTHVTDQPLYVKSGRLALDGATKFTNLKDLHVGVAGALDVDSTVADVFGAVTNLAVEGALTFSDTTATPLPNDETLNVSLSGGAALTLPAGMTLNCATVVVDGVPLKAGTAYTAPCTAIPQLKSGTLHTKGADKEEVEARWTGAAELDNLMTTLGNWTVDGQVPESLNLSDSSVTALIGNGGNEMVPDGEISLAAITVDRDAETCSPFVLGAAGKDMTVVGKITATNCAQVILRGTIASPDHLTQGPAEKDGDATMYFYPHIWAGNKLPDELPEGTIKGSSSKVLPVVLDGMTVEKPVWIVTGTAANSEILYAMPGTTNLFKGEVHWSERWGYFDIGNGALVDFAGGVKADVRAQVDYSEGGTLKITDQPATFSAGLTLLKGKLILDAEGCSFIESSTAIGGIEISASYKAGLEFRRSGCFTSDGLQQLYVAGSDIKTVEFNMTTQRVSRFSGLATNSKSTLHGLYPAMLEICGGCRKNADADGICVMTNSMQVTGGLGFHYVGSGTSGRTGVLAGRDDTYVLAGRDFQSCGDLEVSAGTLELAANATWLNGTNLTVRGTGTLKIGKGKTFGNHAILRLDGDGKISVPDGARQKFAECRIGDARVPDGIYTYATAPDEVKAHLAETSGEILVGKIGGLLILR